jgi:hypothetical protein
MLCYSSVFFSALLAAQQIGVSPVPLWLDGKGVYAPENKDQTVFLDLATSELVVLRDPDAGDIESTIARIGLQNQTDLVVSVAVSQESPGSYAYDYLIAVSGPRNRPLQKWQLLVPKDDTLFAEAAEGWSVSRHPSTEPDREVGGPGVLEYITITSEPGAALPAGKAPLHVRLVSRYRPGYATSFAWSTALQQEIAISGFPAETQAVIARALAPEWNSQMITVPAPRFAPDAPASSLLPTIHHSIEHLQSHGLLPPDSVVAREALELVRYRRDTNTPLRLRETDLRQLTGVSGSEKTLVDILRLTLGVAEE